MKSFLKLTAAMTGFCLLAGGCTTTEKTSAPATMPPASEEASVDGAAGSAGTEKEMSPESSQKSTVQVPVDDGSGQIIPLKDLPKKKGYPYAIKTKWTGLVKSPYAQDKKLVDVNNLASGSPARCPHTGKIFIVP